MKNKILVLVFAFLLQISTCNAATHLKVVSMDEFKTDSPSKELNVRVIEEATLGSYDLGVNSILHCEILAVVDPKRGKRNASFFVKPISYTTGNTTCMIEEEMYGKYSKFVLSKEEIKKIPPSTVIKKTALTVGDYFVKGLSICYSFVEGVVKNEKDNRFKSGVTNAYEESPLSLISEGEQLDIKIGDDFYLVFKTKEDYDEPNYEYKTDDNESDKDKKLEKTKTNE